MVENLPKGWGKPTPATPKAVTNQVGKWTSTESTTIAQPMAQKTPAPWCMKSKLNIHAMRLMTTSKKANQRPRVNRSQDISAFDFPRVMARNAEVPARKMKVGAQ